MRLTNRRAAPFSKQSQIIVFAASARFTQQTHMAIRGITNLRLLVVLLYELQIECGAIQHWSQDTRTAHTPISTCLIFPGWDDAYCGDEAIQLLASRCHCLWSAGVMPARAHRP